MVTKEGIVAAGSIYRACVRTKESVAGAFGITITGIVAYAGIVNTRGTRVDTGIRTRIPSHGQVAAIMHRDHILAVPLEGLTITTWSIWVVLIYSSTNVDSAKKDLILHVGALST